VYFAFYYIGSFARSIIHLSYTQSDNLLITMNGVGVIGRILPALFADRYVGPLGTMIPVVLTTSLASFCWIAVNSEGGLYGWTVVYGFVGGGIQGLFPATLSSLTTDLRMAGTRMGMIFTIVSFAALTGPPIAGQLIQRRDGGYLYAQIFAGVVMFVGGGFMIAARMAKSREIAAKA
jgi:MFS family permease